MKNVSRKGEDFSRNCNKQYLAARYAYSHGPKPSSLVIATLPKLLSRLSRMSWDELRTRTQQTAAKRVDLIKHRLGLPAVDVKGNRRLNRGGKFFFGAEDLPRIAGLLKE